MGVMALLVLLAGNAVPAVAAGQLYVTLPDVAAVAVVDPASGEVTATIPTGQYPRDIAIDRNRGLGYVGYSGAGDAPGGIDVIDLPTGRVTRTIAVDGAIRDLALDASGSRLHVLTRSPDAVTVRDGVSAAILATVALPDAPTYDYPGRLAVGANGNDYVLYAYDGTLLVVDTGEGVVSGELPNRDDLIPSGMAYDARDGALYIANGAWRSDFLPPQADIVTVLDTRGAAAPASIAVGGQVMDVAVDPAGHRLFATTWRQLAIVDTDPLAPIATVPLASDDATRVLYDAAARLAYISHPDHDLLSVVDVDSASQVATIALPARPAEMALLPAAPSGDIAPHPLPASRPVLLALLGLGLAAISAGFLGRGGKARRG